MVGEPAHVESQAGIGAAKKDAEKKAREEKHNAAVDAPVVADN